MVDGISENRGRIEVLHGGKWGTLCSTDFDANAANMICHQLGYGYALLSK